MSKGYKELLKLAKEVNPISAEQLRDLVRECQNSPSNSEIEQVRIKMKIRSF